MSDLTITSLGHSGVLLRRDEHVLVIDPGIFSDCSTLHDADAILITHEHTDHVDPVAVVDAMRANGRLQTWGPKAVVDQLTSAGVPAERVHALESGDSATIVGFSVRAFGGAHALVHPAIPVAPNLAYLIDDAVLHPGDSFTPVPDGVAVKVLLLPVSAPWMAFREAVDYLHAVAPGVAVPIHDGLLTDAGKTIADRGMGALAGSSQYRRIAPGEVYVVAD